MQTRTVLVLMAGVLIFFVLILLPLLGRLQEKATGLGVYPPTVQGLEQFEPQAKRASKY